jgi:hypothetical protein
MFQQFTEFYKHHSVNACSQTLSACGSADVLGDDFVFGLVIHNYFPFACLILLSRPELVSELGATLEGQGP